MTAQGVLVPLVAALAAGACRAQAGSGAQGAAGPPHDAQARAGGAVDAKRDDGPFAEVVFRPRGAPEARVAVEVARTDRQLQRGLMYRAHLPPDAGMLFLFARPRVQSFWMKDTLIPLDIIFVSAEMVVVGVVENAAPRTLTSRKVPNRISQYVLEVNAGWARAHRVAAGVPVEFVGVAPLAAGEGEYDGYGYDEDEDDEGEDGDAEDAD